MILRKSFFWKKMCWGVVFGGLGYAVGTLSGWASDATISPKTGQEFQIGGGWKDSENAPAFFGDSKGGVENFEAKTCERYFKRNEKFSSEKGTGFQIDRHELSKVLKKRLKQDIVLASTSIDASLMTSPIAPRYAQFYYPPTYLPPLSPVYVGPPTITYYSSPPVYVGPPVIVRTGPFFRSFIP